MDAHDCGRTGSREFEGAIPAWSGSVATRAGGSRGDRGGGGGPNGVAGGGGTIGTKVHNGGDAGDGGHFFSEREKVPKRSKRDCGCRVDPGVCND